mgnify:CR=1 FL=1
MLADETAIRYTVLRYRAAVLVPQCFREKNGRFAYMKLQIKISMQNCSNYIKITCNPPVTQHKKRERRLLSLEFSLFYN